MFDVFYYGTKPELFSFEQYAESLEQAQQLSKTERFWYIYGGNDYTNFNFNIVPPSWEWNHVYVYGSQWQKDGGVYLACKWDIGPYNYRQEQRVKRLPCQDFWQVPVDIEDFDFSWHPDPQEKFIHVFGTQWQQSGGPEYHTPGADEYKFEAVQRATALPNKQHWHIPDNINTSIFDFSWHPRSDEKFVHIFGTQWQPDGGPEYHTPGAVEKKYEISQKCATTQDLENWVIPDNIDKQSFDFSWKPRTDEKFVHIFGTQWQPDGGPEYHTPGAVEKKYETSQKTTALANQENWHIPGNIDTSTFDFSWHPRTDEKFIHVFGTQWQPDGGPEYHTPGAVEKKYETSQKAAAQPVLDNWYVPDYIDFDKFDFSWHPRSDEKFIHVFGTQWHNSGGPEYRTTDATEIKFEGAQRAESKPQKDRWEIPEHADIDNFDFSWHPPRGENYVHVFGSQWARDVGPKYVSPGSNDKKYETAQVVKGKITTDIFVIDQFNSNNITSYESVKSQYPDAKKTRGVGNWASIIKKACEASTSDFVWVVSSDYDYTDFDFGWYPETWQSNMIHVFGSKYQKWANVFRVPRWEFLRLAQWFDDIKNFPELNFVEDQQVKLFDDNREIWWIDNSNNSRKLCKNHKAVRFFESYLETIKRIVARTDQEYIWITSSLCDYSQFDFGWEPEPWQQDMLHVFPSCEQKFGDTFYVPVAEFKKQSQELELLDWFDTVNYVKDQVVDRVVAPIEYYTGCLAEAVKNYNFVEPYVKFVHSSVPAIETSSKSYLITPSIWRPQDRAVHAFNNGAACLVPKDAKKAIKSQIYDYDYILRHNTEKFVEKTLDVVFISNGEKNSEKHEQKLKDLVPRTKSSKNVQGRIQAYKAAAELSETEWFFAVFAKCDVEPEFDFNWRPDRLQANKHYIFHAYNPINDLTYGHMSVIAYHRDTILNTKEWHSDVTLSGLHEVVPVLSCTAVYDEDEYAVWRTAFRETIKLSALQDIESTYRLEKWLAVGNGDLGDYSLLGAKHGVEYYKNNKDDMDALQKPAEWEWCMQYYKSKV